MSRSIKMGTDTYVVADKVVSVGLTGGERSGFQVKLTLVTGGVILSENTYHSRTQVHEVIRDIVVFLFSDNPDYIGPFAHELATPKRGYADINSG